MAPLTTWKHKASDWTQVARPPDRDIGTLLMICYTRYEPLLLVACTKSPGGSAYGPTHSVIAILTNLKRTQVCLDILLSKRVSYTK